MKNQTPDFGEPWGHTSFRNCIRDRHNVLRQIEDDLRDRVRECVNACAGMTDPAAEITKLRADLETAENTALRLAEKADAMRAVIVEVNRRLRYIAYEASQMWDASDEARSALAKLKPFLP